jgi:polyhydroxyalkanoate synthase
MAGPSQQLTDPAELSRVLVHIAEQSQHLITDFLHQQTQAGVLGLTDSSRIGQAFLDMTQHVLNNPAPLVETQLTLWRNYWELWQHSTSAFWGLQPALPEHVIKQAETQNNFVFDYIKQSCLLTARCLQCMAAQTAGLDERTRNRLDFYTRQFVEALTPAHFPATNPQVLRTTLESGGENLLQGLQHLLNDLTLGRSWLTPLNAHPEGFILGETIATTPGAVVYQNELMQLIQYAPATEQVYQYPLLAVPPWINKYYLFDLQPQNSLVQWWVAQGFTVFVISWVNPGPEQIDKDLGDYVNDGILQALTAIEQATGEREVNAIGYCLGGTLLACAAAYLSARNQQQRLRSCTYLNTLLDFEQPGELEVFMDEEELSMLDEQPSNTAANSKHCVAFNMLRANDLIWSFFIEHYLLGKEEFPFDLLFWNSDTTRMPTQLHSFYLRTMYQNNLLREPGGIVLLGKPLNLSKIQTPSYYLASKEDHIALWQSAYRSARLFAGPVRFVLGHAGHVAGIIKPSANEQASHWQATHWINSNAVDEPEQWLHEAQLQSGSWWQDWLQWARPLAGTKISARALGENPLAALETAPGSYVKAC